MTDQDERRQAAIKRVEAKRAFRFHAALYVVVNLLLIIVWALTGARYFLADLADPRLKDRGRPPLLDRLPAEADL